MLLPEVESFRAWLRQKFRDSTTSVHYANDLKLFFGWAQTPASAVTVRTIDAYIAHCIELRHATATINRRLAAIQTFYDFLAFGDDPAVVNPVIPHRHYIRQHRRLPRDVEDEALAKLFAVVASARDRAIFLLMLRCGLRVGEVRTLSLEDLYLQPTKGNLPRLFVHGKGSKERVVYLASQPLEALQNWLKVRPSTEDTAVFLNRQGRRFTSNTGIQWNLAAYCQKAGLWLTCHQFRHTFGRHLAEHKVPVTSIQRLLGHEQIDTTQVYIHLSDQTVQADYLAAMETVSHRVPVLPEGAAPAYGGAR